MRDTAAEKRICNRSSLLLLLLLLFSYYYGLKYVPPLVSVSSLIYYITIFNII